MIKYIYNNKLIYHNDDRILRYILFLLQFLNLNHYQPLIWRPLVTYYFENHLPPPPHITTTTSPTAKNVSIEHLKDTVKTFSFFFWSFYLLFFTASADAATAAETADAAAAATEAVAAIEATATVLLKLLLKLLLLYNICRVLPDSNPRTRLLPMCHTHISQFLSRN